MPIPSSWVMRLPQGLREQPGWVFIGVLVSLSGISFALGISDSAVSRAIGPSGLRLWGVFLTITGVLVTVATLRARMALEKLALRWLTFSMLAYGGWLMVELPIRTTGMPITLVAILVVLAEIRVGYIKLLLNVAKLTTEDGERAE